MFIIIISGGLIEFYDRATSESVATQYGVMLIHFGNQQIKIV